jgi:CBS domain-containing protein
MPESAIDSIHTPLAKLVRRAPVTCPPQEKVAEALRAMRESAIGSIIVAGADRKPLGILTLRDVVDRVVLEPGALEAPIASVMTPRPITLPLQATAYSALLVMIRQGVRHVVLMDGERLAGVISERDLFGLQSTSMRQLSTAIRGAESLPAIERFGHDIKELARRMLAEGVAMGPLTAFIASLNDLLTERIVELEFREALPDGVRYCWILMGSEGRSEQTLVTDQDNGLIFAPPAGSDATETRRQLLPVAQRVNQALDRAGYQLCPGEIMAGNPLWCLSAEEWHAKFGRWIDSGSPEALLHGTIFFDLRPLQGDNSLAHELRHWLLSHASKSPRFLHQMAGNALKNRPPLGMLRDFSPAEDGRINLKLNGATPFVDAARIFSLAHRIDETNTERRLRAAAPQLHVAAGEAEAWIAAYYHVQGHRMRAQAESLELGSQPDNRIDPQRLHDFDRQTLKLSFKQARRLQKRLALDYRL